MKLTKERKVLVGILAVAGCALVWDQCFSGPEADAPAGAEAALVAPVGAPAKPAPTAMGSVEQTPPLLRLTEKLQAVDREQQLSITPLSDPFKIPAAWTGPGAVFEGTGATFAQRHHLTAIMVSGARRGSAIIDGELVRVGQTLDGYKLVEVTTRSAVFECNQQVARLVLSDN
jgi:hypothetical protein